MRRRRHARGPRCRYALHEPDFLTFRNSLGLVGGQIYETDASYALVSRQEQVYDITLTSTDELGPSWFLEDTWPGSSTLRERFQMLTYNSRICMPFD